MFCDGNARLTAKISEDRAHAAELTDAGLDVELLVDDRVDGRGHDADLGEGVGHRVDAGLSHEQRAEHDVLLGHVVVQQHPHRHDGRRPRGHRGVQQQDAVVLGTV